MLLCVFEWWFRQLLKICCYYQQDLAHPTYIYTIFPFLICMSNIWMYVISCFIQLAGLWPIRLSCLAKTWKLNFELHMHIIQPKYLISAMLIGTFNFYHFISLSVALTLTGSYKSQWKPYSWLQFWLNGMKFGLMMNPFKENTLILLLGEI